MDLVPEQPANCSKQYQNGHIMRIIKEDYESLRRNGIPQPHIQPTRQTMGHMEVGLQVKSRNQPEPQYHQGDCKILQRGNTSHL